MPGVPEGFKLMCWTDECLAMYLSLGFAPVDPVSNANMSLYSLLMGLHYSINKWKNPAEISKNVEEFCLYKYVG